MRKLSTKEIEHLASRKGVRHFAVENFLMTMGCDRSEALANLKLDTGLYQWDAQTVKVIKDGIELASKEEA